LREATQRCDVSSIYCQERWASALFSVGQSNLTGVVNTPNLPQRQKGVSLLPLGQVGRTHHSCGFLAYSHSSTSRQECRPSSEYPVLHSQVSITPWRRSRTALLHFNPNPYRTSIVYVLPYNRKESICHLAFQSLHKNCAPSDTFWPRFATADDKSSP
jgi:hypothetical protein